MNFSNKFCLLCLESSNNSFEIFGKQGIDLNIGVILQQHFWFEVGTLPAKNICEACWQKVESFHIFYNFVKSIHQKQVEPRSEQICKTKQTTDNGLVDSIKEEPIDIKDFFYDFNDTLDTIDSPAPSYELEVDGNYAKGPTVAGTTLKSKRMKSASTDITHPTTTRDPAPVAQKKWKYICKTTTFTPSKQYKSKRKKLSSNNTADPNTPRSDEMGVDSATVAPKKRKYIRKTSTSHPPHKYVTDVHTSLLSQYFNMSCDRCDTLLTSYRDTKNHYKDVHGVAEGYLICCNKKYVRLSFMLSHCEWHMNPDAFNCSQCSRNFHDKYRLQEHMSLAHAPEAERIFNCNDCDQKFSKQRFLTAHQKMSHDPSLKCPFCQKCFNGKLTLRYHIRDVHSPEDEREFRSNRKSSRKVHAVDRVRNETNRPFECDICGCRCGTLARLKIHIQRVHVERNARPHICEICAKSFLSAESYKYHYLSVHGNMSEKVQCDICGKWLKHKGCLHSHMLCHNRKQAMCKTCGRFCSNQPALRNHIRYAHREASLECKICGKMFKIKRVLKEHMAIHYGITDLYTCTFCTKTFRSNANMYAHRKRAHPEELEELRKNSERK